MVALIPARAGSKRVPGKNTKLLNGQPLIAYTIAAAQQSGIFTSVAICSDRYTEIVTLLRPVLEKAAWVYPRDNPSDDQPDIVWVRDVLHYLTSIGQRAESFAILRPTSPFRTADTIRRAYQQFCEMNDCVDSIRAVRPVTEHPYKMWRSTGPAGFEKAYPIKPLHEGYHADGTPWHSSPTQSLPTLYVQTSALEMAWTRCVEVYGTISGRKVAPFFGSPVEFCSIDTPDDWDEAERLARTRPDLLPPVDVARVSTAPAALQ
jgi:CMP-N,N'-diacetyllegionaminic acid synthase